VRANQIEWVWEASGAKRTAVITNLFRRDRALVLECEDYTVTLHSLSTGEWKDRHGKTGKIEKLQFIGREATGVWIEDGSEWLMTVHF
jgi:hypothetical protein